MLKLYIRPVYLLCPEEEVASLSLLVESRREKVRTIKGKENRSRSIAAGLLLRYMLLEELILHYIGKVFKGYKVKGKSLIRVVRNADIDADSIYAKVKEFVK